MAIYLDRPLLGDSIELPNLLFHQTHRRSLRSYGGLATHSFLIWRPGGFATLPCRHGARDVALRRHLTFHVLPQASAEARRSRAKVDTFG